ncbi:hypothetical protein [Embleya sp. NBC_00896]|uniref:hypothetical protein n=1 Tax=Embleya sp. NBC_00896 TaxID=2975961 RepID=UPI00386C2A93|nr:hypothetical protein OG928_32390 [Embleya sp. NBC_00896]
MTKPVSRLRLENVLHVLAAGVLVTSMALAVWARHPREATSEEFLAGVSNGTITSVDYDVDDLQHVYVRWRATDTTWREAGYSPKERAADPVGCRSSRASGFSPTSGLSHPAGERPRTGRRQHGC